MDSYATFLLCVWVSSCSALVVPLPSARPALALRDVSLPRVGDGVQVNLGLELAESTGKTLLVLGTHPGDFNCVEYAQKVRNCVHTPSFVLRAPTHTHTPMHKYTHSQSNVCTHTHIHTHTSTHTHTHTYTLLERVNILNILGQCARNEKCVTQLSLVWSVALDAERILNLDSKTLKEG